MKSWFLACSDKSELMTIKSGNFCVRVLGGDGSIIIVPDTTEELASYIENEASLRCIEELEQNVIQQSDEKVGIPEQTSYAIADPSIK